MKASDQLKAFIARLDGHYGLIEVQSRLFKEASSILDSAITEAREEERNLMANDKSSYWKGVEVMREESSRSDKSIIALLRREIYKLCLEIEALPASEQETKVVVMASAIPKTIADLLGVEVPMRVDCDDSGRFVDNEYFGGSR